MLFLSYKDEAIDQFTKFARKFKMKNESRFPKLQVILVENPKIKNLGILVNKLVLNLKSLHLGLVKKRGLLKERIGLFKRQKKPCLMKTICLSIFGQKLLTILAILCTEFH